MAPGLAALLLVVSGSVWAGDPPSGRTQGEVLRSTPSVDLSHQFPDAACRSQAGTESCHAFGSIALLEAALYRRYGAPGGVRIRLSEADLFVRKTVAGEGFYDEVRKAFKENPFHPMMWSFDEAGKTYEDTEFAIEHGVATAEVVPWDAFKKRFDDFREAKRKEAEAEMEKCRSEFSQAMTLPDAAARGRCVANFQKARVAALDFLEEAAEKNAEEAEKHLLGEDKEVPKDREFIRKLIEDFDPEEDRYDVPAIAERDDDSKCLKAGEDRRLQAKRLLDKKIPVVFGMNIAGLGEWGHGDAKSKARHYFVVTGYADGKDGLVFKSRNSWGGLNPEVRADRLCRVYAVVWLETDLEDD